MLKGIVPYVYRVLAVHSIPASQLGVNPGHWYDPTISKRLSGTFLFLLSWTQPLAQVYWQPVLYNSCSFLVPLHPV
eukprot:1588139-Rhodomonas_salina.1